MQMKWLLRVNNMHLKWIEEALTARNKNGFYITLEAYSCPVPPAKRGLFHLF